jgi:hypothetical protein
VLKKNKIEDKKVEDEKKEFFSQTYSPHFLSLRRNIIFFKLEK